MAILSKGTDFSTGDQVTAVNLDALVDSATFAAGAVDNTTTALDSSSPQKIIVKNGGIGTTQLATSSSTTTGVTFAKMQHVASGTVLANSTSSEGDISALAVADTKIIIGNGSGLTAAALSGDATMTNGGAVTIANDAVTLAKMQNVAANTVLVRDASSEGNISAKAVTNKQILIGDGTGFTAAALGGDATMTNGGVVTIANDAVTTAKIDNDAVTLAKIENVSANTVLVRDANSTGDISAKAVANTQILIGDGTGFTAAALSGDATMTNAGVVTIAANAVEGSMILSSTTLQNGVKCADQSASDNSTKIANTKYVDAQCNLIPSPATVITTNAGNTTTPLFYTGLTKMTDPNSIISINSGNEIQFASTGTYFIKAGISFSDNDGSGGDYYVVSLVSNNSSSPTIISSGGQPFTLPFDGDNSSAVKSFIFSYAVTNTTNNRLSIFVNPVSSASAGSWAGAAAIEITKIS